MIYFLDTTNYIIKNWRAVFFTEPILLITLIFAFIISIRFRKGRKSLILVPFYIGLFIIEIFSEWVAAFLHYHKLFDTKRFNFVCYLDYLLTVIELITFIIFFNSEFKSNKAKQMMLLFSLLFCLYSCLELYIDPEFPASVSDNTQSRVYTMEAILLLVACSFYFKETFKSFPFVNIKQEPSFWVSTGLLFFFACTLPYSLLENYLRWEHYDLMLNFYSIFYIFYILLFYMIIKAYLCQGKS